MSIINIILRVQLLLHNLYLAILTQSWLHIFFNTLANEDNSYFICTSALGSVDFKFPVNPLDIESLKVFCEYPTKYGCTEEMKEQFLGILHEGGKVEADNAKDVRELFIWFLQYL